MTEYDETAFPYDEGNTYQTTKEHGDKHTTILPDAIGLTTAIGDDTILTNWCKHEQVTGTTNSHANATVA